jgi:phosphoketolase
VNKKAEVVRVYLPPDANRLLSVVDCCLCSRHYVNALTLTKLQSQTGHPHGLSDKDFEYLFTKDKTVIFAFHAHRDWIHRLTCRRTNHDNIHIRDYEEEDLITTLLLKTVMAGKLKPKQLVTHHFMLDDVIKACDICGNAGREHP